MTADSWLTQAHAFRDKGTSRSLSFRRAQLQMLAAAIESSEGDILDALHLDLGKPVIEAYASEVGFVLADIRYALKHLTDWASPQRRHTPLWLRPASSRVHPEPYGVALVIGPWNYPFALTLSPLVSAMAAGNGVCVKPSEYAPHVSGVITRLLRDHFQPDYITAVEGDAARARELVCQPFDKIFFTGSSVVGRLVLAAAAPNLTPVTLELGGKSPCIVCADADLQVAAHRIVQGKFLNAGQTCVAPDHVWVQAEVVKPMLKHLTRTLREFYGPDPQQSPDYGRIVNLPHLNRLTTYLNQGYLECGGAFDQTDRYFAPTILTGVSLTAPIMQEEIFGPILPVLPFEKLDDVISHLRTRPRPLALYAFTGERATQERLLAETASGGVCFNDTLSHILSRDLPFGGIGESGMGAYHGKAGFDTFTHYRSVLTRSPHFDPGLTYPPPRISLATLKWFQRLLMSN
ncbi:MAG: aldehyde dehydrogenase family protein [bacterium]